MLAADHFLHNGLRIGLMGLILLLRKTSYTGLVLLVLMLAGCQVNLYSGLSEREGNEMIAVLLDHGIDARKLPGKEQTIDISVAEDQLSRAVDVLRRNGFPRDTYESIGSIFKKEGMISSPLEERIRYIYGLSQEISETLTHIDGVITARVHVVLPEQQPYEEKFKPSSASVFIKYTPGSDLEAFIPKIKQMVYNSIEGLDYNKISVALFPGAEPPLPMAQAGAFGNPQDIAGVRVAESSALRLWLLLGGLGGLLLLALLGFLVQTWRIGKLRSAVHEEAAEGG
jgi:type III secretion protein J